ncbi:MULTISPECIES: hypothetical protein [unclassified Cellulophaga]|uniref:hypothetical protein n=1 Tax=unclassified Cellulophaga TaxID=2634405 RepID=UPI0026E3A401|nr:MULTISPECIES: hypothetical protein [unclassified Cellulophaga]MDO6492406.1 hypothetical protein [Cellulophaga sp. 2_MG-2023]MDO6496094.1 hypothetical protein [Cellulophaga sp. 3_MG-2023]
MKRITLIIILLSISTYGQQNQCLCSNGTELELKGVKPAMTFELANGETYNICGFVNSKISDNQLLISDFDIFNCKTDELLLESLSQNCFVNFKDGVLEITEMGLLRFGNNWEYETVPLGHRKIYFDEDTIQNIIKRPDFKNHKIDQNQIDEFMLELENVAKTYKDEELLTKIEKLEVLALIDNEKAWEILLEFRSYFKIESNELIEDTLFESIERIKKQKK